MRNARAAALLLAALIAGAAPAGAPVVAVHMVEGPHQPGPVAIEVVAPDVLAPGLRYPVLYLLPVEPGTGEKYGSGIREAARGDLANRHGVICVAPAFAAMPWYGDHPSDPGLRQERHFIETVLPWVEANYPAEPLRGGRYLLGFSKSGNGAFMLLLRHPELFERALAWDAPVGKMRPDQFGMLAVFGTDAHFDGYAIPRLLASRAAMLREGKPRLVLMPDRQGDHGMEMVRFLMVALGIPHGYAETDGCRHHWESGWMARAAALLLEGVGVAPGRE